MTTRRCRCRRAMCLLNSQLHLTELHSSTSTALIHQHRRQHGHTRMARRSEHHPCLCSPHNANRCIQAHGGNILIHHGVLSDCLHGIPDTSTLRPGVLYEANSGEWLSETIPHLGLSRLTAEVSSFWHHPMSLVLRSQSHTVILTNPRSTKLQLRVQSSVTSGIASCVVRSFTNVARYSIYCDNSRKVAPRFAYLICRWS
jgi:hypothetical protein